MLPAANVCLVPTFLCWIKAPVTMPSYNSLSGLCTTLRLAHGNQRALKESVSIPCIVFESGQRQENLGLVNYCCSAEPLIAQLVIYRGSL